MEKNFFTCNLTVIGEAVLEKTECYIHVYGPGAETDNLLGSELLYKYDVSQSGHLL